MTWRGPRTATNPNYTNARWAKIKKHWVDLALPRCQSPHCLMPGVPIDYTKPRTRPASLNVGHVMPVWMATQMGWTDQQIWCIENTRPEHRRCNIVDGARQGNRIQRAKAIVSRRDW